MPTTQLDPGLIADLETLANQNQGLIECSVRLRNTLCKLQEDFRPFFRLVGEPKDMSISELVQTANALFALRETLKGT